MKILQLNVVLLVLFSATIFSQEFEIWTESDQVSGNLGEELIYNIEVENISQQEIVLAFVRVRNDLPEQWSSSLCFDLCFAPFVDSVTTSSEYGSSPIQPGEIRDLSVHIYPLEIDGSGEIEMLLENVNDRDYSTSVVFTVSTQVTSVIKDIVPAKFELEQNYPNPFSAKGGSPSGGNPVTTIEYKIPAITTDVNFLNKDGSNGKNENQSVRSLTKVSLTVYDILGREVAELVNESQLPGKHLVQFNAASLPSGIYFYELKTSQFRSVRKMILEK